MFTFLNCPAPNSLPLARLLNLGVPRLFPLMNKFQHQLRLLFYFFFSFVRRVPEFCLFLPSLRCPRDRDNNFDFIVFLEPPVLAINSYLFLMSIQHFMALLPRFCTCSLSFFIKCKRRPCFFSPSTGCRKFLPH